MQNTQGLREGLNQFEIIGTLKEKKLEVRTISDGSEAIMGELIIKVGEFGEHTVNLFSKKMTKAGAESKLFKAYNTVKETYISLADIAANPEHAEGVYATRLSVRGDIDLNDYYSNGELKSFTRFNGKFINSITDPEIEDKAEFDAEIFVKRMKEEFDRDGIATDRLDVEGLLVGYNSRVSPIDFKVTEGFGVADYMSSNFGEGDTIKVWGELVNSAVTKTEVQQGFGKQKENVVTTYKREIVISGGDEFALSNGQEFDAELIKVALGQREEYLQEVERKGKQKNNAPARAQGFGAPSSAPKRDLKPADIPF